VALRGRGTIQGKGDGSWFRSGNSDGERARALSVAHADGRRMDQR
jgi:hypothetical protein